MDVRKLKIRPEDEARLRELLIIHEKEIDRLTDAELDAAEQSTSRQVQRLLQKQSDSSSTPPFPRLHPPFKTGTVAFLAAAAALLFVQRQVNESPSSQSSFVSKGTEEVPALSCESSVVESDGTTPEYDHNHYLVKAGRTSYLKLHCGRPVYVHVGFLQGETLHLELSNLLVSIQEKVVMKGSDPVDFTALAQQKSGLVVLVTEKPLSHQNLAPADRADLWQEELPVSIKP